MIISILSRRTRLTDRAQWEERLRGVLPKIREKLEAERGFVSVEYGWTPDGEGDMVQTTTWETLDDCRRYVREGGAATVATIEDAAVPTASHPHGAWVRRTFDLLEE